MGAKEIPRRGFIRQLKASINREDITGRWEFEGFGIGN